MNRDDGLGVMRNVGKPEIEKRKKIIIQVFRNCGLSISNKANLQIVQYIDVEFDSRCGQYMPLRKPNSDHINIYIAFPTILYPYTSRFRIV